MADDPPQQPVEWRDDPTRLSEGRSGLDSMMVPPPVPASQLPDAAQPQASVGGGASPQGSAQDATPDGFDWQAAGVGMMEPEETTG
jgi:hypothetical protein